MAVLSRTLILASVLPMLAVCSSSRGKIRPIFIYESNSVGGTFA